MAAVVLNWPPATFWASTPHELWAALDFKNEQLAAQERAQRGH
jgi:hypothetical protein